MVFAGLTEGASALELGSIDELTRDFTENLNEEIDEIVSNVINNTNNTTTAPVYPMSQTFRQAKLSYLTTETFWLMQVGVT